MVVDLFYFNSFKCKCGECRRSCCEGWRIGVSLEEYFKLTGIELSEELRYRMDVAFMPPENPSPEVYRYLKPNFFGRCPFHGEDGLCMLQVECGEENIPSICRLYPRTAVESHKGIKKKCCSGSCEKVVEMLRCEEPVSYTIRHENDETAEAPFQKFLSLLTDRTESIEERIQKISMETGSEKVLSVTEAMELFYDVLTETGEKNELLPDFLQKMMADPKEASLYAVRTAEDPKKSLYVENLLVNHLIYMDYPQVDNRVSEALSGLGLMAFAKILLLIEGADMSEEEKVDLIADAFRASEHGPFYYNVVVLSRLLN